MTRNVFGLLAVALLMISLFRGSTGADTSAVPVPADRVPIPAETPNPTVAPEPPAADSPADTGAAASSTETVYELRPYTVMQRVAVRCYGAGVCDYELRPVTRYRRVAVTRTVQRAAQVTTGIVAGTTAVVRAAVCGCGCAGTCGGTCGCADCICVNPSVGSRGAVVTTWSSPARVSYGSTGTTLGSYTTYTRTRTVARTPALARRPVRALLCRVLCR